MQGRDTLNHFLKDLIPAFLIFLFSYTAIAKLMNIPVFEETLRRSPMVEAYAGFVAFLIPITELTLSGFLLFSRTRLPALLGAAVLLAVFTGYILSMLIFSTSLPCTCGGIIAQMSWTQHFIFNVFCIGLAYKGTRIEQRYQTTTPGKSIIAN